MPENNNPFSVGKSLNIGIYDLKFAQHADDLITKAESEGKNVSIAQYKGHDVLRVSNKSNFVWEALKRVVGIHDRNIRDIQNYRASLPKFVEPKHQGPAQSLAQAIHNKASTPSLASPELSAQAETETKPLSQTPAPEVAAPVVHNPIDTKVSDVSKKEKVASATEPAPKSSTPKLSDLFSWYKSRRNNLFLYDNTVVPGFAVQKDGGFLHFANEKVQKDIIAADGGNNGRIRKHSTEKVHISIDREQFSQAWDKLAPLLFSDKNPFAKFKLSDSVDDEVLQAQIEKIRAQGYDEVELKEKLADLLRVSEGLQITLYFQPGDINTPKERLEYEAHQAAEFLKEVSAVLQDVAPGKVHGRSLQLTPYIDYRNELWQRGDTSKPVQEAWDERPLSEFERSELEISPFFATLKKHFSANV